MWRQDAGIKQKEWMPIQRRNRIWFGIEFCRGFQAVKVLPAPLFFDDKARFRPAFQDDIDVLLSKWVSLEIWFELPSPFACRYRIRSARRSRRRGRADTIGAGKVFSAGVGSGRGRL